LIPRPAQYLLRFDDLCPTVSSAHWQRFLPMLVEFGVRPILAVVPHNHDRDLERAAPAPDFWQHMRTMEASGAAIALHGYRHLCRSKGKSLVPLHTHTEFAGVSADTQRQWSASGLEILRAEGLNPRLWVAPRHGFDRNTLSALRNEGISLLSDGFARVPFTRGGLTWIPQQLWAPVEKSSGLWTICVHPNTVGDSLVDQLRLFLHRHAAQFTSVDRVVEELKPARLSPSERARELLALWKVRASRARKRIASK
jgi:peptidoglycan/xylan/chitin deacetylase (PgdA/CDA1 family)